MNELKDIIYSLVVGLSTKKELSIPRLIKAMYLYDWSSTLNSQEKDARLNWTYSMCGPACREVQETIAGNAHLFNIYRKDNHVGGIKEMVRVCDDDCSVALTGAAKRAVDHVIRVIKNLTWQELSHLIYSTMPMVMASVGSNLDLVKAAEVRRADISEKEVQSGA